MRITSSQSIRETPDVCIYIYMSVFSIGKINRYAVHGSTGWIQENQILVYVLCHVNLRQLVRSWGQSPCATNPWTFDLNAQSTAVWNDVKCWSLDLLAMVGSGGLYIVDIHGPVLKIGYAWVCPLSTWFFEEGNGWPMPLLDSLDHVVVVQRVHPNDDDFRLNELILKLATLCYFGQLLNSSRTCLLNHTQPG